MARPTDPFDPASMDAYINPILNRAAVDVVYLNDIASKAELMLELFLNHGLLDIEVATNGHFVYRVSDTWKKELAAEGHDLSHIPLSHLSY